MSSSSPSTELALEVQNVSHRYESLPAVDNLTLAIRPKEVFGILGPNGSGKSTLFRLISTVSAIQTGSIRVSGFCTKADTPRVRRQLGVVFQSPSLDRKLTALENIRCQAALYGLVGAERDARVSEFVKWMGLEDKLHVRCEKLSGGQKRRVELAKGLLHRPSVLLLDEPSTGLDPAARLDLWHAITQLRDRFGTTVILTTHLLEEADKCDRIAILNAGKLVACDRPDTLRSETDETIVTISTSDPQGTVELLADRLQIPATVMDQQVRILTSAPKEVVPAIMDLTQSKASSITVGRPSLEDVFIAKTGHKFHRS